MKLSLLQWNAQSLRAHSNELKQFIATSTEKPHLICVQETWLQPQLEFRFPGYSVERRDRPDGRGGGVAILISESISYSVLDFGGVDAEALGVKITAGDKKLTIVNIYNPPQQRIDPAAYKKLLSEPYSIIVGDFNAYSSLWGGATTDINGLALEDLLEECNLVTLNTGEGTHIQYTGGLSPLDLTFVSQRLAARCTWSVLGNSLGSDHLPVITTIDEQPAVENPHQVRWAMKRANWGQFVEECNANALAIMDQPDNELAYQQITTAIISAATVSIPRTGMRPGFKALPYWDDDCSNIVAQRNAARNKMSRTKDKDDIAEYRRLKGVAQWTIKNASKKHWEGYCSTLTSSSKLGSVWKMAGRMTGRGVKTSLPSLHANGQTFDTNIDKANLLAKSYAEVSGHANSSQAFSAHRLLMEAQWLREKPAGNNAEPMNVPFSSSELAQAIGQCKSSSAPGQDGINYEMVHHLPTALTDKLLAVYNRVWEDGKLISSWKESQVIPIPKPKASRDKPESYRPIALTACLCKLLERMIVNRLQWYLEMNGLLNPLQSGFRKQRSTTDHTIRLQDAIHKSISNGQHTLAIFLDFSKAFDMVWKEGLLAKLRRLGVGGNMHRFIDDFLTGRKIRVVVGDQMSDSYDMENGIPQGSVISPTLFNIMINDFPQPADRATEAAIFADDCSAWRSGVNVKLLNKLLQDYLNRATEWSEEWGFKLSNTKSTAMLFTKSPKPKGEADLKLTINGTPINVATEFKFLGVIFDRRLTWDSHITAVIDKAKKALNLMRNVAGQGWGAGKKAQLCIYKALIRSRIEFGHEVYYTASDHQLSRLDTVQRRALLRCCGAFCTTANNVLQQDCGEMPLALRRKRAALRTLTRAAANDTNPARSVIEPHWTQYYGKFTAGKGTFSMLWSDYRSTRTEEVAKHQVLPTPPWERTIPNTDCSLSRSICKKETLPATMKTEALTLIHSYAHHLHIYTDASKMADSDRVGAAFYVEELEYGHAARLTDGISIYAAELTAIQMAIDWLLNSANLTQDVVIFTDSLSSVQSFSSCRSTSQPIIFDRALTSVYQLQQTVTFAWIPSHVGIRGNEAVDRLAKLGTERAIVDINLPLEFHQEKAEIDDYILGLWQTQYDNDASGAFYRAIEPKVNGHVKYSSQNKSKERMITRLRFGKCLLNKCLQEIKKHPDGRCGCCGRDETVEHLLLECNRFDLAKTLNSKCRDLGLEPTLRNILSNACLSDIIFDTLHTKHVKL